MGFWGTTAAAPSWFSVQLSAVVPTKPGYLRPECPSLPHIPPPFLLSHLKPEDAGALTALWRSEYGGEDWTWVGEESAILPYLTDRRVVGLGLTEGGRLVATIFAVPFGKTTCMNHGSSQAPGGGATFDNYGFHVVEGLVVHRTLRGRGVAAWMIAAIDGTMSRLYAPRPFACLWAREVSKVPAFPTFVSCRPYAWKSCVASALPEGWVSLPSAAAAAATFGPRWASLVSVALESDRPVIATVSIDARRGGLQFFTNTRGECVVVSDTCRATLKGLRIYEVVWASSTSALDAASRAVSGLLFTTADVREADGWTTGTSGYHAYSIYNYWPPAFGDCEILVLREEL